MNSQIGVHAHIAANIKDCRRQEVANVLDGREKKQKKQSGLGHFQPQSECNLTHLNVCEGKLYERSSVLVFASLSVVSLYNGKTIILICASQAISLVLRLSHRASRVFKAFSDDEVIQVLSALMILGQHDEELLAAMEKHLPGVCFSLSFTLFFIYSLF